MFTSALEIVKYKDVTISTSLLIVAIAIGPVNIILWSVMFHANANLVLEQQDLVD